MNQGVRQLSLSNICGDLEAFSEVSADIRSRLEALGVTFVESNDPGDPAPTQMAVIELDDGSQYVLRHLYDFPEGIVAVSAQTGAISPPARLRALQTVLGFADAEVRYVDRLWHQQALDARRAGQD